MKRLIVRLKTLSFERMKKSLKAIHERSNKSYLHIVLDILRCWILFGTGYVDYYDFYFDEIEDVKKATYINVAVNHKYIRKLNNPDYYHILDDKAEFLNKYKDYIKRDFIDLRIASFEEFEDFYNKHIEFMAKPVDGLCGKGIELIKNDNSDTKAVYNKLLNDNQLLLEERIKQCPELNKVYPYAINTIRVVTALVDGKVSIMWAGLRVGNHGNVVDNFNHGGMLLKIDEDGVIRKPAFDKELNVYYAHPMTGLKFDGFKVPMWEEAKELAKQLALVTPEVGLTGFDLAISTKGVDVVEGNQHPGYDVYQNKIHLDGDTGLKAKFDQIIMPEEFNRKIFGKGFSFVKGNFIFFISLLLCLLTGYLPIWILFYLLTYKNIDKCKLWVLFLKLCLIGFCLALGYACLFVFAYDLGLAMLYSVTLTTSLYLIPLSLVVGLLSDFIVYPVIDKLIESINYKLSIALTILVILLNISIIGLIVFYMYLFIFII